MPFCFVFPAKTNRTILKNTTAAAAIDSSQKSPGGFFFRFSIKTLVAEIFDILSKSQIFSQSSTKLAHKLLENSVGGSNMFSKYLLFPLLWGSQAEWLKFRLIRFLSKVFAKNKKGNILLSDGPNEF